MAALKSEYKQMLLDMTPNDITATFINEYLADRCKVVDGRLISMPSKIKTSDTFTLEAKEYFNKTKIITNVGLFIYNKFIIEEKFSSFMEYVNEPITNKVYKEIESKISYALLNDIIEMNDMVTYLNKIQWISKQFNSVFSTSFTEKSSKPLPSVIKKRDQLIKANKDALEKGDVIVSSKIEAELVDMAKKELEKDPGMDLYASGARGNFKNNYKALNIMKGPILDPGTGKYDVVTTNFTDGIKKEDVSVQANAVISGAYPKAIGTADSGYFTKQLNAAFQSVVLDAPGSDCGTTNCLEIVLTPWIRQDVLYRYIYDKGKLILLDENNIDKYMNTTIKMRSPMYCVSDKLCSKCAGILFEKLGITNVGLTITKVSSTLSQLSMKKFHDSSISVVPINVDDIIL